MASIRFLGAAVTGSRFLVEAGAVRIFADAGLFQGSRHAPNAAPLHPEADALAVLPRLSPLPSGRQRRVAPGVSLRLDRADVPRHLEEVAP